MNQKIINALKADGFKYIYGGFSDTMPAECIKTLTVDDAERLVIELMSPIPRRGVRKIILQAPEVTLSNDSNKWHCVKTRHVIEQR